MSSTWLPLVGLTWMFFGALIGEYVNPFTKILSSEFLNRIKFSSSTNKFAYGSVSTEPAFREDGCPVHRFTSVKELSRKPHIVLIEGFLTPAEAEAIVRVAYIHPLLPLFCDTIC